MSVWRYRSEVNVKVTDIKTQFERFRTSFQFELKYGYEMLHRAWRCMGEVPNNFLWASIPFQGHIGQEIADFDLIWALRTVTPFLIHWWLWNDAKSLK